MDNENAYKNMGELEKKGIEPLPPTSLSTEAKAIIEAWGLSEAQIHYLQEFTSQFRYDLCVEKVDRLAQKKAEIFSRDETEYVNFPSFYDVNGRLDGQCGDIGRQWIIQINESNLVQVLNSQRTDGNKIVTGYYTGLSKTHFCNEGSNHVWNGLALVDSNGDVIEEVYFDAAFQAVMSKSESGYTQKTVVFDARSVEADENADIPIGWVEINGTSWQGNVPGTAVLGVSHDFQYSFSIGFVKDKKTSEIKPIISRLDAKGKSDYFIYGSNNLLSSGGADVTPQQESEIRLLLDNAEKIQLEKGQPTTNRVNWVRKDISG